MQQPIVFDNINTKVIDDLKTRLSSSSRVSIAVASLNHLNRSTGY